ncbi:MAG: nucleoside diphosphate kinase regulator [Pseudomonadales bacterium]|nr:nucleoside diphosphate kinase regulator [Pseudomonadales bacterium]
MEKRPEILLTSQDLDDLERLLDKLPEGSFPGKAELQTELNRAKVVGSREVPPDVVTMNSKVRFALDTGEEFCLTLVYPKDLDGSAEQISILAPVGSALLGLSTGEHIEWPRPGGGMLQVRIVEVVDQPERSSQFRR